MNSELKEKLEFIIHANLFETFPESYTREEVMFLMEQAYNLDRTPSPSGGIKTADEIYGYVFKGKFFKSLDDMRGMTMSEDNKPIPVYIHNQFAGDGWISVEDRLPEDEKVVLVYTVNDYTQTAFLEESTLSWVGIGMYRSPKVTHWQPLPSPPQNTKS